ncbi:MAG: ribonuclease P protein subunit [Thermoplasmata archaeon]|nr:ribonuclease P protein subunit [Thermoplasmata archaeon]
MRTAENLGNHELIGLKVTVLRDERAEYEGVVIDETMNTFRLFNGTKRIMVPKEGRDFLFNLGNGESVLLKGTGIMFRPEDRTKKVRK